MVCEGLFGRALCSSSARLGELVIYPLWISPLSYPFPESHDYCLDEQMVNCKSTNHLSNCCSFLSLSLFYFMDEMIITCKLDGRLSTLSTSLWMGGGDL